MQASDPQNLTALERNADLQAFTFAGDAQAAALLFDLEVPPPPLPPPLPLRALRRPGAAALEREAERVAKETAAAASGSAHAVQTAVTRNEQRLATGFANLDLPAGFVANATSSSSEALQETLWGAQTQRGFGPASIGLLSKGFHERSSSNSSSSLSAPGVPMQRCSQPRTQLLRSDSLSWRQSNSPSAQWVSAAV